MPQIDWPELDLFSLVMPAAGVYLLWVAFSVLMTDRQKAREAAEEVARASGRATGRQNGSRMPEGAFSFGDEDASAEDEETKKE